MIGISQCKPYNVECQYLKYFLHCQIGLTVYLELNKSLMSKESCSNSQNGYVLKCFISNHINEESDPGRKLYWLTEDLSIFYMTNYEFRN